MKFTTKTQVTTCTLELNFEEMVMLCALLDRQRKAVLEKYPPKMYQMGGFTGIALLDKNDYGQGNGNNSFLFDLHEKLNHATK